MTFNDLIKLYKVYYVLVTEILDRFSYMNHEEAKKSFVMYQNFINFTQTMKTKAKKIQREFHFNLKMPDFYQPEDVVVESLKACVESKQGESGQGNLGQVADKIKGDMKGANDFQNEIQQKAWFDDEQAFSNLVMGDNNDKSDDEQEQNVDVLAAIQNSDFSNI